MKIYFSLCRGTSSSDTHDDQLIIEYYYCCTRRPTYQSTSTTDRNAHTRSIRRGGRIIKEATVQGAAPVSECSCGFVIVGARDARGYVCAKSIGILRHGDQQGERSCLHQHLLPQGILRSGLRVVNDDEAVVHFFGSSVFVRLDTGRSLCWRFDPLSSSYISMYTSIYTMYL